MKGKITKLKPYKSGKGFFIGIDYKQNDYMFFGDPGIRLGETVIYEEGKASPEGNPTLKSIRSEPIEAFIDEDKPRSAPIYRAHDTPKADARETYWQNREKHDLLKDATITRLSCISSACDFYSQQAVTHEDILGLAAKLEKFAKGEKIA